MPEYYKAKQCIPLKTCCERGKRKRKKEKETHSIE